MTNAVVAEQQGPRVGTNGNFKNARAFNSADMSAGRAPHLLFLTAVC